MSLTTIAFITTTWLIAFSASMDMRTLAEKDKRVKNAFSELPSDMRTKLETGGASAFTNVTDDVIEKLPVSVFANIGTEAIQGMGRDKLKSLAKTFTRGAASRNVEKVLHAMSSSQFEDMLQDMQNSTEELSLSQKEVFVKIMKEKKGRPSTWSADDVKKLGSLAKGLVPSEIRDLANAGRETFEASIEEISKAGVKDLSKGQLKELVNGALKTYGKQDGWTADTLSKMATFMPSMKPKDIKQLSTTAVKGAIRELATVEMDGKSARELMKKLKDGSEGYGSPGSWTADDLNRLGNLTKGLTMRDIDSLNADAIRGSLRTLSHVPLSKKQASKMARKVKTALGSPNTWTADTIKNASGILRGLKPKDLRNLPTEAVMESVEDLKQVPFSRSQARVLAKKLKESLGDPSSWNESTVQTLGPLVSGLPLQDLAHLSGESVRSAIKAMKGDRTVPPSKQRAMLKKAKESGTLKLLEVGSFIKSFSLKDLESIDVEAELGLGTSIANGTDDTERDALTWKLSQARKILQKVRNLWGDPADSASKWVLENIGKLKGLLIGVWKELLQRFPNDMFEDVLEMLAARGGFTAGQREMILSQYKRQLFLETPSNFSSMTEDQLLVLGNLTVELTAEELDALSVDISAEAVRQMSEADMTGLPRDLITKKTRSALKLLARARGLVSILKPSQLTSDELLDMGGLGAGLTSKEIGQLDADAFKGAVSSIGQVQGFDKDQLKALASKAKDAYRGVGTAADAPSLLSDTDIYDLGIILAGFTKQDFLKMNEERVEGNIDYLGTLPLDKEQAEGLLERATSAKRKRRDMSGKTGDELIAMGNSLMGLTIAEIDSVDAAAYDEAASTVASIPGFSQEQLQAWARRAKAAWNSDPAQFTSDQLHRLGVVVVGFTATDIGKMPLSTDDVIESLGSQPLQTSDSAGFTLEQLTSALQKIKSQKSKEVSGFNGDELASLNNFALAMTPTEIGQISSATFGDAIAPMGSLTGWSEAQMEKLKEKAVAVYGAVSTWSADELREAGAAIGGMTTSELKSLSKDHVGMITRTAISQIPVDLFLGFTVTQLQGLDVTQVMAVTDAQKNALPAEKRKVLADKEGSIYISDAGSGGAGVEFHLAFVFTTSLFIPIHYYQEAITRWITRAFITLV
ncbi:uncharacterized protein LOC5518710 isoform X2 [Nematostella vectensis]|uniref:uncharacterized protein LOC5518710 isoform X2 n=1 Tax=Nematostella vectensis TaxID=45351 RepID=UPI002076EA9D|nr:uncharacterized protein LOC5518710 isoform X2 [Nematostella vectensis]